MKIEDLANRGSDKILDLKVARKNKLQEEFWIS